MSSAFALLAPLLSRAAGQDVFTPSRQLRGSANVSTDVVAEGEVFAAPSATMDNTTLSPPNMTSSLSAAAATASGSCCSWCPYHGYCSPKSHSCYHYKGKHYYHECSYSSYSIDVAAGEEVFVAPSTTMDNNTTLSSPNMTSSLSAAAATASGSCCSWCPYHGYCSPKSHSCYHYKGKYYYDECSHSSYSVDVAAEEELFVAPSATMDNNTTLSSPNMTSSLSAAAATASGSCCSWCPHHGYCSPKSHSCYHYKGKYYYDECSYPNYPPPAWKPSGWCPSFAARGFHPGNCRKSYTGSWYQWICTQYGRTYFCSSDCSHCNT